MRGRSRNCGIYPSGITCVAPHLDDCGMWNQPPDLSRAVVTRRVVGHRQMPGQALQSTFQRGDQIGKEPCAVERNDDDRDGFTMVRAAQCHLASLVNLSAPSACKQCDSQKIGVFLPAKAPP